MKITRKDGSGAKQLEAIIKGLQDKQMKTGFFGQAKYDDGTPVAYVAAIQEFGDAGRSLPPRPFMRPTVARDEAEWKSMADKSAKQIAKGASTTGQMLNKIGEKAAGGIKKSISEVTTPPLTLTTLRLRKLKKQGVKIGGAVVGQAFRDVNFTGPRAKGDKSADVSGVSTKPLVDDGILINSVTHVVENI